MHQYIEYLLRRNNCVIIPQVGALIANYKSAQLSLEKQAISVPNKSIAFNQTLSKNDGLLVSFVKEQEVVSYQEAEQKVIAFANEVNQSLAKNKNYRIPNIGRLFYDKEEYLQFEPNTQNNVLVATYGLPTITVQPITRLKDARELYATTNVDAKGKRSKNKIVFPLALVLLLILASMFLLINTSVISNMQYAWASFVPQVKDIIGISANQQIEEDTNYKYYQENNTTTKKTATIALPTTDTQKFIQEMANTIHQTVLQPTTTLAIVNESPLATTTTPQKENYNNQAYICIGSFMEEELIDIIVLDGRKKGYTIEKEFNQYTGYFRLYIATTTDALEQDLQQIKSEINANAWVFCSDCKLNF